MKWLTNRYAYPLVILVIIISIGLQLVWLNQLFKAQRVQVIRDLEQLVGQSAGMSSYLSLVTEEERKTNYGNFFLSPEWLQFKQAYNNMRFNRITSRFNSDTKGDSTFVNISLRVFNGQTSMAKHRHMVTTTVTHFDKGVTMAQERDSDRVDLRRMDSIVHQQLGHFGIQVKSMYIVYTYNGKKKYDGNSYKPSSDIDFTSQQYSYNLRFLGMYQLVVPSVKNIVFYRMRYYLISSCFMIMLTTAVFFFILRLMRNQRLYTQARIAFTGNMTHELKTPVATISLALETIMENNLENDPRTLRSYLDISRSELRRLNLMIDKVLNLEHFDNGQMKLRTELFDVQQGLQQVIDTMRLQLENSGAIVSFEPMALPCFVTGDPVHLTNVFYNLIENALKYGGDNLMLFISCHKSTHEAKITFKDNGPGIASAYHEKIFERFFRVPSATNDIHNVKGTGLGLNYVKQIIEKHGGHIKLESEIGKGSSFIIYLPTIS
jgi:nitrogen-specific signal transduction histidine kinase